MTNTRILVTGATGFIGSHLTRELLQRGYRVRATRRPSSRLDLIADVADQVEWVELDLVSADARELEALGRGADLCVHCAWYAEPGLYQRAWANVDWVTTSLRLLDALAEGGCPRAVYIGTCFEYDHRFGHLSEQTSFAPWTLYGSAKLSAYFMGGRRARDLDLEFAWVRLFYQYGPHEDPRRLVPHVIQALLRGEEAEVTSGEQIRDFLHVVDVAGAVADVALSDQCGAVNVGSGRPVRVRDVVEIIARHLEAEDRVRLGAVPDRPSDPPFICANNQRLVRDVGWRPRYDLEDGLLDTIEWWRRHMDR